MDNKDALTLKEPARTLPVEGRFDVVVAGGGVAGVAAAVAAARNGRSVCLLEKCFGLGGLATLGNVTIWLPICDGRGRQLMGGLPEELLKLSVADLSVDHPAARFNRIPACWREGGDPEERKRERYKASFNPVAYLLALEALVKQEGISLLYDTRVCAVHRVGGCVSHLIVENGSGRSAIACRMVVDATGDADVCFLAGEATESLDSNVLCGWFYHVGERGLALNSLTHPYAADASREGATGPFFRGDDAQQVTAQVLGSRHLIRERLAALRTAHPEQDIQVVSVPSIPCFRMTRRLVGAVSLGKHHMHAWFDDAVGLTGDWRRAGPVYAVPMRALLGARNSNLVVAGRCISADTTVWDATRAIPACALTGTAAGVIAALACAADEADTRKLTAAQVQRRLREQGALLNPKLVEPLSSPPKS